MQCPSAWYLARGGAPSCLRDGRWLRRFPEGDGVKAHEDPRHEDLPVYKLRSFLWDCRRRARGQEALEALRSRGPQQLHTGVVRGGCSAESWRSRSLLGGSGRELWTPREKGECPVKRRLRRLDQRPPESAFTLSIDWEGSPDLAPSPLGPAKQVRDATRKPREMPSQKPQSGKSGSPGECC